MFFFLQQLSVRSITAPSLCHCNVHGFPGKHNSSRWPLAIAQRDRKKKKKAPNLTLKGKLLYLEPSPLPSGGDLVRCLLLQAGKWCSIFPGFPQSPRRRQCSFRGGCTTSESALPNSSWKALKGFSSSWSYDAGPVEMSAHPGMAAMPRVGPCHSPVPSHKKNHSDTNRAVISPGTLLLSLVC